MTTETKKAFREFQNKTMMIFFDAAAIDRIEEVRDALDALIVRKWLDEELGRNAQA